MTAEVSRVNTKLAARIKANCFTESILVTAFTAKEIICCKELFIRKMHLKLGS